MANSKSPLPTQSQLVPLEHSELRERSDQSERRSSFSGTKVLPRREVWGLRPHLK